MMSDSLSDQAHDCRLELCEDNLAGSVVIAPCNDCDGEGCGECRKSGFKKADVVECPDCRGEGGFRGGIEVWTDCTRCKRTGRELEYHRVHLWKLTVDSRHGGPQEIICYEWDLDYEISHFDKHSIIVEQLQ